MSVVEGKAVVDIAALEQRVTQLEQALDHLISTFEILEGDFDYNMLKK